MTTLERECASRATREETEFIVGKLAQAEQERDAIQETLAAVEHEVAIVYCHITGSRISKCNTLASVVISEADDFVQKDIDEAVKEAAEQAEARVAALEGLLARIVFYAEHEDECEVHKRIYVTDDACDCGLLEVEAEINAALAEPIRHTAPCPFAEDPPPTSIVTDEWGRVTGRRVLDRAALADCHCADRGPEPKEGA